MDNHAFFFSLKKYLTDFNFIVQLNGVQLNGGMSFQIVLRVSVLSWELNKSPNFCSYQQISVNQGSDSGFVDMAMIE